MKPWQLVWVFLFGLVLPAAAVDRQAFTITRYQLEVQIDRRTQVMAVTGQVALRNDTKQPQKLVTLQVSSSLAWNAIALEGQRLQWLGDTYTSDIDHTGALSEVIVTLPKALPTGAGVTLDVQYGGTVTADATRLTRMGAPAEVAARNDWDQISDAFTAVRGLGYVVWYPVAIEAVSLSEGDSVFTAIANWKLQQGHAEFDAHIVVADLATAPLCIAVSSAGSACGQSRDLPDSTSGGKLKEFSNTIHYDRMLSNVPAFAAANYLELTRPTVDLLYIADHTSLARDYAAAAEANDPLLHDWIDDPGKPARIVELTDPHANPWQDGALLFTPLREAQTATLQLLLLPAQVSARFHSARPWIQDGLERFLQAVSVENRTGRKAAIEFLDEYRKPLVQAEQEAHPKPDVAAKPAAVDAKASAAAKPVASEADNTLLNTSDELYLRGKGGFVFWMLRDMLGDEALQHALRQYQLSLDNEPIHLQKLLQASSKRDLEWFFDDWVYRDRGLPEFHVDSAYTRPLLSDAVKSFLVTVTVENRGRAGAEVPVVIQTPSGEKSMRVLAKAGSKGAGRIELPVAPDKVVVNDGSVPEADLGNNEFPVPPPANP